MMGFLRTLHAWAGLALCLLLVPLALSGSALVFKPQWLRATVPFAAEQVAVTPDVAARAMRDAQAAFPDVRSVIFAGPEIGLHQVNRAAGGGGYLEPNDGALVQAWAKNERVVDWLFDLHHHLLAGGTGVKVAGFAGLLAAVMILTGLIIWAPAWRSFGWRIAPDRSGRAGWLAAHRDLGLVSAPIALVIVLTGSAVALNDLASKAMGFTPAKPPAARTGDVDWPRALSAAQQRFPDAELRIAALPPGPGKPAQIRLRQLGEWHKNGRTIVWIDPADSRILRVDDAMAYGRPQRLYNVFWPIHASKVGGVVWKALTFLTGLAVAALALYGAESYRRKLFARPVRRPRQAAPAHPPA